MSTYTPYPLDLSGEQPEMDSTNKNFTIHYNNRNDCLFLVMSNLSNVFSIEKTAK